MNQNYPIRRDIIANSLILLKEFNAKSTLINMNFNTASIFGIDKYTFMEELEADCHPDFLNLQTNIVQLFNAINYGDMKGYRAKKNIEKLAPILGDRVQVVFVSGTDFGTQRGLFISLATYRDLYKPFQKAINDKIHELTNWKIFIHTCGGIYPLIPDLIEAGFDILNPVQCSAKGMEPKRLKKEFGDQLVFWGGGIDTQKTLPFGTPDDVYNEVRQRIEIFSENSGFVFNSIHNILSNVPTENILAMFRAIDDFRK